MPWRRMREWWYSSTIADLATRWSWVVSFSLRPFYPLERAPGTHWIGGFWVGSGHCGAEENLSLPGIEPELSSPVSPSQYRLSYLNSTPWCSTQNYQQHSSWFVELIFRCELWKSLTPNFQQNLLKDFCDAWKILFMVLYKLNLL
jgi:hypothetical protein